MMHKLIVILFVLGSFACKKENDSTSVFTEKNDALLTIPEGFPKMQFPEGNELTAGRWDLGKKLFYEKRLSINNSLSCASCHKASLAFADDRALSPGVFNRAGTRNAPSLANVGYQPYLLREGSLPTLEMQVLVPIQEHNEFNHNIIEIVKELGQDTNYQQMSFQAYGKELDAFVITRAISNFQRTILSRNSDYDKFVNGNISSLNAIEKEGMKLFFSNQTNCSACHGGYNFTNYSFQNNGLDSIYADNGRQRFTNESTDEALFKVPSLRNVGLTAPYMHDGSVSTLQEVVEHYNKGGLAHKNKSTKIQALNLSMGEKEALVAFLNSLSDFDFVNDPKWEEDK